MDLQIVTANRLHDGRVVYLTTADSWTEDFAMARTAGTDDEAALLVEAGEQAVRLRRVVAPYLIDVVEAGGQLQPTRYREQLRAFGPSSHPAFGRPSAGTGPE